MRLRRRFAVLGLAVVLLALVSCATTAREPQMAGVSAPAHPLGELPATFKGTLPCATCPGIDYHLNLLDDGV